MSDAEWEDAYRDAWDAYFTWEHMETVARRHAVLPRGRPKKALQYMNEFKMMFEIERLHPLEGGIVRRKRRKSRRADFRRVPALIFYPRFAAECVAQGLALLALFADRKSDREARLRPTPRAGITRTSRSPRRPRKSSRRWACSSETRGGVEAVEKKHRQDARLETVRANQAARLTIPAADWPRRRRRAIAA